jgi:hypothetical protein
MFFLTSLEDFPIKHFTKVIDTFRKQARLFDKNRYFCHNLIFSDKTGAYLRLGQLHLKGNYIPLPQILDENTRVKQ